MFSLFFIVRYSSFGRMEIRFKNKLLRVWFSLAATSLFQRFKFKFLKLVSTDFAFTNSKFFFT